MICYHSKLAFRAHSIQLCLTEGKVLAKHNSGSFDQYLGVLVMWLWKEIPLLIVTTSCYQYTAFRSVLLFATVEIVHRKFCLVLLELSYNGI